MTKKILLAALIFLVIGTAGFFSARAYIIFSAQQKADAILAGIPDQDVAATAVDAARYIFSYYDKDDHVDHSILFALRPYWSSLHLPAFIRMPSGAIETLTAEGWCDDAARSLSFILQRRGIESKQWNMITPAAAHAATVVFADTPVLVDPYYGYATIRKNAPTDPYAVSAQMQQGKPMENFFVSFGEKSRPDFYEEFAKVQMGAQYEPLAISVMLPRIKKGSSLTLGKIDGNSRDVTTDSFERGLTYTWTYIGHKFDRGWTRHLIAKSNVRVEIILTKIPDEGVLRTLSPRPTVDGTKLTWNLLQNERIVSKDGMAAISWRRLNSYIDIDQILITPRGEKT